MTLGVPVIAFNISFNRATMGGKGYYFSNDDPLIEQVKMISHANSIKCGKELKKIAQDHYNWKSVCQSCMSLINKKIN